MIRREEVENILKLNGVSATAPDEQIRSILLSARYNKDEVDAALMVLRENVVTNKTRVDGLHKVFRSGDALAVSEISQLLNIDVDITDKIEARAKRREIGTFHVFALWILSLIVAVAGIMFYLQLHDMADYSASDGLAVSP